MGRRLVLAVLVLALSPAAATAGRAQPASWAAAQIRAVTAVGLFDAATPASFRPDDPLTAQDLEDLVFELKQRLAPGTAPAPAPAPPPTGTTTTPATTLTTTTTTTASTMAAGPKQAPNPTKPVTITQLDARLVGVLGLAPAAAEFLRGARAAGLTVPSRFGTEVVARLLGLRLNHPAPDDALERLPGDPASRAEAAYSVAQIIRFDGYQVETVQALADTFWLPELSDWQKLILSTAVGKIGMPYIWGGTSDRTQRTALGLTAPGGYDCSGFVWRVYKLQPYPNEGTLASVLRGRTTYQMSGEVPKSKRIPLAQLEPADVLFFGAGGPRSTPAQVGHMGIYLGNGWLIHSSDNGVALARLDGWYAQTFAWARRPLAEAGLEAPAA